MRGSDAVTGAMFSYVDLEARVPKAHPLRAIREIVNEVLIELDDDFAGMYAAFGRPSIAPEKLLRGSLLQAFYTIRSERQLMEQLDYNLLFRWFVGLGVDDAVWDHSTYSKNRDRLLEGDVARKFLKSLLAHPKVAPLLSDEHFSVDGTLIEAWASMKSFVPKDEAEAAAAAAAAEPPDKDGTPPAVGTPPDGPAQTAGGGARRKDDAATNRPEPEDSDNSHNIDAAKTNEATEVNAAQDNEAMQDAGKSTKKSRNGEVDFHGQKRSNATHRSTTDAEARLYRKGRGKEAKLSFIGHAMAENRHGLVVETGMTQATGTAERDEAKAMIERHSPGSTRRLTVGADKGYDTAGFVSELRDMCVTPHVAQKAKGSAIDARTTRHEGYKTSQRKRKLIEEPFGWAKTIGGMRRPMRRGVNHMGFAFTFTMAAYNLIRLPKLIGQAA